ncbi:MAG: aromatic ring-hydroxylating dioxygenase subunit alpha [Pseudomonadota bacterium]|nr:aromatic ring-hydroxylating dioxygenase subunit alpha [Pseudomonadota bacterium]
MRLKTLENIGAKTFNGADLVREGAIHRRIYTDPAIFSQELTRIFHKNWLVVGHVSEVARPGDFKTLQMGDQPIIVSRDEGGELHVLLNTCRHRGALVCREDRGNTKSFECLYHSWSYHLDGCLAGLPKEDGYGPSFEKADVRLWPVPRVETHCGLIFACLDENIMPLAEFLGPAAEFIKLALRSGEESEVAGVNEYRYQGNWKLHLDNTIDGYHVRYLHRFFSGAAQLFTQGESIALGNGHAVLQWETAKAAGDTGRLLGLDKSETTLPTNRVMVLFPSCAITHVQDSINVRIGIPLAPALTHVNAMAIAFHGETSAVRERRTQQFAAAQGPAGSAGADDIEAFEASHEGFQASVGDVGWLSIARGLHREQGMKGDLEDDTALRGMYDKWQKCMNPSS